MKDYRKIAKKEKWNNIPVHYCIDCNSLNIIIDKEGDYCRDCYGDEIEQCHIDEWLELNKDKQDGEQD